MDASDFLAHRAALIGAGVALAIGTTGGLILRIGSQTEAPIMTAFAFASEPAYTEDQPVARPSGKVPDYVVGTDYVVPKTPPQPPVAASYEVPEYVPTVWNRPKPKAEPIRVVEPTERTWPSTGGDILNTRLPGDPPETPVAPAAPQAPQAIDAPAAPSASTTVATAH
ncbi:hypothetical protein [Caulobacter sp. LjRoot300]|uniref:hypothetical protein n=1 Tax=Caulobacter sp. LjRoot300 TaxID=3342321 RepID=UPI003ED0D69F